MPPNPPWRSTCRKGPPSPSTYKRSCCSPVQNWSHRLLYIPNPVASTSVHSRVHFCEKIPIWPLSVASSCEIHIGWNGAQRNGSEALLRRDQTSELARSNVRASALLN